MSVLAPLWLAAAALVAVGVVIAHLFSTSTPPEQVLPTARFVPQGTPMAVLRTTRLTDVGLLVLRVLAVAMFGLALAGAHVPRSGPSRVVLVDVSRAAAAVGTANADDADKPDDTDRVIVFDSVPRAVDASVLDTLKPSVAGGSISAALVAAHRSVAGVTRDRDQMELVIVSPLVNEEVDSATATLLALWEGPVRLQRVPAARAPEARAFEVRAVGDDPVAAALASISKPLGPVGVRVIRGSSTADDSLWARQGGVLVHWPVSALSGSSASSVWAVSNARHTVVGVSKAERAPQPGIVIARWSDGAPAATESVLGAGCVRDVAVPVDPVGDLPLRDAFRAFAREVLEPCGGARDFTVVPDSMLLSRKGVRAARVAPAIDSRLPVILALLALAMLAAEQLLRRRQRTT